MSKVPKVGGNTKKYPGLFLFLPSTLLPALPIGQGEQETRGQRAYVTQTSGSASQGKTRMEKGSGEGDCK